MPFKEVTKITLEATQAIELDAGVFLPPGSLFEGGNAPVTLGELFVQHGAQCRGLVLFAPIHHRVSAPIAKPLV